MQPHRGAIAAGPTSVEVGWLPAHDSADHCKPASITLQKSCIGKELVDWTPVQRPRSGAFSWTLHPYETERPLICFFIKFGVMLGKLEWLTHQ